MSRLSCSDLRTLFRETPTAVVLVDGEGRIRQVNDQAAEMFGYGKQELEGELVEVLVPEGLEAEHRSHRERYTEEPEPRPMGIGMELRGERRDGSAVPVEISLSPLELEEGPRIMAAVRDISERKELRTWGTEAVEAAEEERLRIARELHDDLAQRLAALQVRAKLAADADSGSAGDLVEQVQQEIRTSSERVRQIIRGLRPPALSELGLAAALRQEAQRQLEDTGVERAVDVGAVEGTPDERTQIALYRVTQEALRNAIQHAAASRISLLLRETGDGWLELSVADDGAGFEPERAVADRDHYGLVGMRERVGSVGGEIDIDSAPGEGTQVVVRVPVDRDNELRTSRSGGGP